eukprot:TRINITY_DN921_c5_g1_i1.p1 TRINITY_DN921_c5_g1~~TRINITY_DN921_c5_g1_i1.p1  ORF type:complete len:123 (-),score=14.41 TRINITY_DN921_c5_g1_i1:40-408(-)
MEQMLDSWELINSNKFSEPFQFPVTKEDAEDYEEIIKNPIDLDTIRQRIENGTIATVDQFRNSLKLMFDNCFQYNGPNSILSSWGKKLQTFSNKAIAEIDDSSGENNEFGGRRSQTRSRRNK